jgi:hypothetical protein
LPAFVFLLFGGRGFATAASKVQKVTKLQEIPERTARVSM